MSPESAETKADRYVRAVGRPSAERYQLDIDELVWLLRHCTRLGELRLGLLRAVQSSLPGSGGPGMEAEFKGLLTNLIIMETRVSDRNEGLLDLLKQLADARAPDRVPVDSAALTEVVQSIIEASHHVGEVAGEER